MSSNIQVQRVCKYCGKEFTAKTTVTKYCSDTCSKRAYKARKRAEKVDQSNKETHRIKTQPIKELKAKEFLTISEACKLLSVSRWTIWRAIKNNELKAGSIGRRKLIRRSDIDKLFKPTHYQIPEAILTLQEPEPEEWKQAREFDITECYTLTEVQNKYGISEKALYDLIKRNSIPKLKKGWYAYVPKAIIDNLLK